MKPNCQSEINQVKALLNDLGGEVTFERSIMCKLTPHSKPERIYKLSIDDNLEAFSKEMLQTIRQRLKWIIANK